MELEGKAKRSFESWAVEEGHLHRSLGRLSLSVGIFMVQFKRLPDTMKYGMYKDFFMSTTCKLFLEYSIYDREVRIIDFNTFDDGNEETVHVFDTTYEINVSVGIKEKYESFTIEKACDILNKLTPKS